MLGSALALDVDAVDLDPREEEGGPSSSASAGQLLSVLGGDSAVIGGVEDREAVSALREPARPLPPPPAPTRLRPPSALCSFFETPARSRGEALSGATALLRVPWELSPPTALAGASEPAPFARRAAKNAVTPPPIAPDVDPVVDPVGGRRKPAPG